MSHQDKASRVSIFPLSGQAWWEVFRLHFHYVPFISGASVFPSPWGRVTGGRCRSVTFWPEVPPRRGTKVAVPSPGPSAAPSLSRWPSLRVPAALRGRAVPACACEADAERGGEGSVWAPSTSLLVTGEKGGSGRVRGPPRASGGAVTAARRCPALWTGRPLWDRLPMQKLAGRGTYFSLTHRKPGL